MRRRELLTLGYSGHDPASFVAMLQSHGVELVVDVRQNPTSRKRGFSRTTLSAHLAAHGIVYRHLPSLGVPRDLRNQLRAGDCTLTEYFAQFRTELGSQPAILDELIAIATEHRACLLCLEHNPNECHRTVVAELAKARGGNCLSIIHL